MPGITQWWDPYTYYNVGGGAQTPTIPIVPGSQGASAQPVHQFPTFEKWGGKDGARASVVPMNPYGTMQGLPKDYNAMSMHMANNKSWTPENYFGGAMMNPRYAQFAGMQGGKGGGQPLGSVGGVAPMGSKGNAGALPAAISGKGG